MIKGTVALLLEKDVPMSQIFYESEEIIKEIDQINKDKQSAKKNELTHNESGHSSLSDSIKKPSTEWKGISIWKKSSVTA